MSSRNPYKEAEVEIFPSIDDWGDTKGNFKISLTGILYVWEKFLKRGCFADAQILNSTNPIGDVIQKHEKKWLRNASHTLIEILQMPSDQASILAELMLILRLGLAHRFATSAKPEESHERAKAVFTYVHSIL